jgi:CheY-like chemotaxis protein
VANARDATGTDGVTVVRTDRLEVDGPVPGGGEGEVEPGTFVRISVEDTGAGMSPETLARAFEPFFSTKAVGQGTGLGLSMVYGIVRQSGGFVRIDSTPGAGTVITVCLPLVEAEVTTPDAPRAAPRGRGEAILVVEDESVVRSLASRVLEAAGYRIYQAPNGAAALDFLTAHPDEVDLVLTDIVMPRMSGRELAERIRERQPGLPIVFMSGYSGDEMVQRGLLLEGIPLIKKPFAPDVLETAVRSRLDSAARSRTAPNVTMA